MFVILSVGVMVGIFLWTTDQETWSELRKFRWIFVPVVLGFGTIRWFVDGMAFVVMAKHGSLSSVSVGRATAIRLEGHTLASVVPFLVGTFSMHAYLLHKEKMRLSESVAISALRAILPVFIFLINIPILFLMKGDPMGENFFGQFIKVVSLPFAAIIVFFIVTLFYPHQIKKVASSLVRWWGRIKILHVERIVALEERVFHEIDQFSKIFWTYLKRKKHMLIHASVWIFFSILFDYFMAVAICWGFGYHPSLIKAVGVQFLMRPLIFLAPTPGGVGIWEFTYLGFFSLFMPQRLIGVAVFIWRFMMTYFPSIVGVFLLMKEFRGDESLRRMVLEKGKLPEQALEGADDLDGPEG